MFEKIIRTILFLILSITFFSLVSSAVLEAQQMKSGVRFLYLIRHGDYTPQDDNLPDSVNVLTPLGIAQARLVSARLKGMNIHFNLLISSTMTRARQTAEVINEDFPELKLEPSDLVRECTPPSWRKDVMAGVDTTKRLECVNNLEAAFQKYFIPSPNGKDRNDIIVCHGNVIRYLVTKVLRVDTQSWLQMSITNCSLTIIRVLPDGTMKLDAFSDYGHIPENLRTYTGGKNKPKELLLESGK
ncbi:MAG: histidine phosphatase family protein [Ignavibacteriales bacterium]|nr:histidine phosphatase family protein [Ignavibacteriales bacterium]